ncbi:MAG: hypothetical protein QNJ55_03660 [Xenococcus sp. MO_188.B8]|nr:hypothetical protein [Xenococcus sp. MO_188.B8]
MNNEILVTLAAVLVPVVGFFTPGTIRLDIALGADMALILIVIAIYSNAY